MGATHKETVTELVKAMINAGHIKPHSNNKEKENARDILKQSIYLVEYGVNVYKDPHTKGLVEDFLAKERLLPLGKEKVKEPKKEYKVINPEVFGNKGI